MQWINPPTKWGVHDQRILVTTHGKTDFWRVTLHDFIQDDGHFYYETVTGDFTATVKVTGNYATLYDQAGLMIREDASMWLKCGIEYLDGIQQASAVITREFSDWSIVPLPDNPKTIWMQVKRIGSAVEVYYSRDGAAYVLIRQGYLSTTPSLQVGIMCAAPKGDGFDVTFEDFMLT